MSFKEMKQQYKNLQELKVGLCIFQELEKCLLSSNYRTIYDLDFCLAVDVDRLNKLFIRPILRIVVYLFIDSVLFNRYVIQQAWQGTPI